MPTKSLQAKDTLTDKDTTVERFARLIDTLLWLTSTAALALSVWFAFR